MEDLFEREQSVLDCAGAYLARLEEGEPCDRCEYESLVAEYGRLLRQVRRLTKISDRTAEELNASKNDMTERAYHDPLTGLYNRRYMEEKLEWLVDNSDKYQGRLSMIMVDVDHFKTYNDAYGHGMGDECLKTIARALQDGIYKDMGFAARYGGEEFLIVFPGMEGKEARKEVQEMLQRVRDCRIAHECQGRGEYVTISAGVASGIVQSGMRWKDIVRTADRALYQSKRSGRDQYTYMEYKGEM